MDKTTNVARYTDDPLDDNIPLLVPSIFPRIFLLIVAWGTLTLAVRSPTSLTAVLVKKAGFAGELAALVFMGVFVVMSLDVLIHDVLPARYRPSHHSKWVLLRMLARLWRWRWLTLSLMSTVYVMFVALGLIVEQRPEGSWVLLIYYSLIATGAMALALYGKITRYNNQMAAQAALQETAVQDVHSQQLA